MKLIIADDHTLFRDALLQYIERAEPDSEVLVAADLQTVFQYLESGEDPDLILLDYRMPGMYGVDGLRQLKDKYPHKNVALMSGVAEQEDIQEAIEIGISAYFPKTMSGKALIRAIQLVLAGERFFSFETDTKGFMPSYYDDQDQNGELLKKENVPDSAKRLTQREHEVLGYLLEGASNKEIANDLDLQVVTIKLHVRGICRKLGAKNRTQAALLAKEYGLGEKQTGT